VKRPKWVSTQLATAIHDEAIDEFGGASGLRDPGLLERALERPRNLPAHEPARSIFQLACTLCIGLAKNHPFADGNKRTALLVTRVFLYLNGYAFEPREDEEVLTWVAIADDSMSENELVAWLKQNCTRMSPAPTLAH
jgi:death-on-curing protein